METAIGRERKYTVNCKLVGVGGYQDITLIVSTCIKSWKKSRKRKAKIASVVFQVVQSILLYNLTKIIRDRIPK